MTEAYTNHFLFSFSKSPVSSSSSSSSSSSAAAVLRLLLAVSLAVAGTTAPVWPVVGRNDRTTYESLPPPPPPKKKKKKSSLFLSFFLSVCLSFFLSLPPYPSCSPVRFASSSSSCSFFCSFCFSGCSFFVSSAIWVSASDEEDQTKKKERKKERKKEKPFGVFDSEVSIGLETFEEKIELKFISLKEKNKQIKPKKKRKENHSIIGRANRMKTKTKRIRQPLVIVSRPSIRLALLLLGSFS